MPRQRIDHNTISRDFPADFPQRLKRFKEESRLPWAEIARLLGAEVRAASPAAGNHPRALGHKPLRTFLQSCRPSVPRRDASTESGFA